MSAIDAVRAALWAAKVVVYAGLFIGIGGAFFRAWVAEPDPPVSAPWLAVALIAGLVATPASVGLQGLDALDLPLSGPQRKLAWETGLETSYGFTAIVAAFALFAGLFGVVAASRLARRSFSLIGLLGIGIALALSGHAATAAPRLLTCRPCSCMGFAWRSGSARCCRSSLAYVGQMTAAGRWRGSRERYPIRWW